MPFKQSMSTDLNAIWHITLKLQVFFSKVYNWEIYPKKLVVYTGCPPPSKKKNRFRLKRKKKKSESLVNGDECSMI